MYRQLTIVVFLFCIIAAEINHPNHVTHDSWIELQDESSGMWIAYKEYPDITWCRTASTLPYGFNQISTMIEDLGDYHRIFDRVTESRVISDDIVYIRVDMPFPVSDRDYIVKYTTSKDSSIASHKFQAVKNDNVPVYSSSVRLENAAGEWYIKRLTDSSTRVVYTWNGDLGGSFPSYALTTAWAKQGSEMIVWLQESLEELNKE
jgi:hypothetical protein